MWLDLWKHVCTFESSKLEGSYVGDLGYRTIFASLRQIPPDHSVWSIQCIFYFSLLVFCWEFWYLCSTVILACNFRSLWNLCLVLVSGWCWLQRMSSEAFLPLQFFWNSLRRIGVNSSFHVWLNPLWSHLSLAFCLLGIFLKITDSISSLVIGLFIFSISFQFSLGRWYVPRSLSISPKLSILFVFNCL